MKITKYGHACLLVEEAGARILIDPGVWNPTPATDDIDAVLITHEHQDHIDMEQVRSILAGSPNASVVTHAGVGKLLEEAGIPYLPVTEEQSVEVKGVVVPSFGHEHAIIYGDQSPCQNTGFLIAGRLFVPGDALHDIPSTKVEILALPTGAPWMKLSEAIDYAKQIAPRTVFPVHDAMYTEEYARGLVPRIIGSNLPGIDVRDLPAGGVLEL